MTPPADPLVLFFLGLLALVAIIDFLRGDDPPHEDDDWK